MPLAKIRTLAAPLLCRSEAIEMLMCPNMVVPEAEEVEIVLGIGFGRQKPLTGELLEGLEEALDAAVLPGRKGGGALMADAEQAESEPEERRGEDGFVVYADGLRLAEAFDGVEDGAEYGDRGLCGVERAQHLRRREGLRRRSGHFLVAFLQHQ